MEYPTLSIISKFDFDRCQILPWPIS